MISDKRTVDGLRVTILLATKNGAPHLREQLNSYLNQTHQNWDLWVSDDASTDNTLDMLREFKELHGSSREIKIIPGPQSGHANNFLSLLCHPDLPEGPVALSDQDDVWLPEKIQMALTYMDGCSEVCLYGAQSIHTDCQLRPIGKSRYLDREPCFLNSLVQNVVSGHSCVLSKSALKIVKSAGCSQKIPHHDWWLYQLISGAGGQVSVDPRATVLYRQHKENKVGAHQGIRSKLHRFAQINKSTYSSWIHANISALSNNSHLLTEENRKVVNNLKLDNSKPGLRRALKLYRYGIHRQSKLQTACLYMFAAMGRV